MSNIVGRAAMHSFTMTVSMHKRQPSCGVGGCPDDADAAGRAVKQGRTAAGPDIHSGRPFARATSMIEEANIRPPDLASALELMSARTGGAGRPPAASHTPSDGWQTRCSSLSGSPVNSSVSGGSLSDWHIILTSLAYSVQPFCCWLGLRAKTIRRVLVLRLGVRNTGGAGRRGQGSLLAAIHVE